jgi:hypothetical protein
MTKREFRGQQAVFRYPPTITDHPSSDVLVVQVHQLQKVFSARCSSAWDSVGYSVGYARLLQGPTDLSSAPHNRRNTSTSPLTKNKIKIVDSKSALSPSQSLNTRTSGTKLIQATMSNFQVITFPIPHWNFDEGSNFVSKCPPASTLNPKVKGHSG